MVRHFSSWLFIYICVEVSITLLLFIRVNYYECQVLLFEFYDRYSLFGLYFTLRTNEFLRCMVITSLLGAIPGIGNDILFLL